MIADLKLCPCCGYFPEHEREHYTEECGCVSTVHRVHCRNCGLATPRGPAETLRWWNIRRTEDALRAENQRLREALADALVLAAEGIGNSGEGKVGARLRELRAVLEETKG